MVRKNIETAIINSTEIAVDVSSIQKAEQIFFNATDMAKPFHKRPNDYLSGDEAGAYIEALLITRNSGNYNMTKEDLVKTRRGGKGGGTWLHKDLGLGFARWLNPMFAVRMDIWVQERLQHEREYRDKRLESRTSYFPLTKAISEAHDDIKPHHFSNENNLLYRIVLGMTAKQYKEKYEVSSVKDHLSNKQLSQLSDLQVIDTGLLKLNIPYQNRKQLLLAHFEGNGTPYLLQANG